MRDRGRAKIRLLANRQLGLNSADIEGEVTDINFKLKEDLFSSSTPPEIVEITLTLKCNPGSCKVKDFAGKRIDMRSDRALRKLRVKDDP